MRTDVHPQKALSRIRILREKFAEITALLPFGFFFLSIFFGYAFVGFYAFSGEHGWAVLSGGILIGGAAFGASGVIGFLFGLPRTFEGDHGLTHQSHFGPNTNLEQISDWLTKLLLGAGLTQIGSIPRHLRALTEFLAPTLGARDSSSGFALALILYYLSIGFTFGYMWTRIFMAGALRFAEERFGDLVEEHLSALAAQVQPANSPDDVLVTPSQSDKESGNSSDTDST